MFSLLAVLAHISTQKYSPSAQNEAERQSRERRLNT